MKDISASSCLTYQHPVTQHEAETQNNVVAVDGSEILSSPVEVGSLSHYLRVLNKSQVVFSPAF